MKISKQQKKSFKNGFISSEIERTDKILIKIYIRLMALLEKDQSSDYLHIDAPHQVKDKITSQFHQKYREIMPACSLEQTKIQQRLNRNGISYHPKGRYSEFSFEAEKVISSFPFFRINVEIGHFRLFIQALRVPSSKIIQQSSQCLGKYGEIYFTTYQGEEICIKSFKYKEDKQYQSRLFASIKQLSILKICSIFQCAPFMEKYFGFDLLIFDDCIQFAAEKGREVIQILTQQQALLKQQLSLIHSLHIIHFDIKPQNVVFSRKFGKPVFIDFGLSEIVKEKQGFKTYTNFKGTPDFCSPQIFAIMLAKKDYVDLYYNDALGLDLVIDSIRRNKSEIEDSQDSNEYFFGYQSERLNKKMQSAFLYISFTYHYLSQNEKISTKLLGKILEIGRFSIKELLQFIKRCAKDVFLSIVFYQTLQPFSFYLEYQDIQKMTKRQLQRNYLRKFLNQSLASDLQTDTASSLFNKNQCHSVNPQILGQRTKEITYLRHYVKLIKGLQILSEEEKLHYLSISFQCIRFDVRNLQFSEKAQVALTMNNFLNGKGNTIEVYIESNGDQQIEVVKHYMVSLLEICLAEKPCKWIKDHIFEIFQQIILLDVDFHIYLNDFFSCLATNFSTVIDHIIILKRCQKLRYIYQHIDTRNYLNICSVHKKFGQFIDFQWSNFSLKSEGSKDIQIQSVAKIMSSVRAKRSFLKDCQMKQERQCIRSIKDTRTRLCVLQAITQAQIQHSLDTMNVAKLLSISDRIKRSQLKNLDFLSFAFLTLKIIHCTCSYLDLREYCNYIADVINCPYIYNLLKSNLLKSILSKDKEQLQSRIDRIFQVYPYSVKTQLLGSTIYSIFEWLFKNKITPSGSLREKLIKLYNFYQQSYSQTIKHPCGQFQDYLFAHCLVSIDLYFFKLSQETRGMFIKNMHQTNLDVNNQASKQNQDSSKLRFLMFKEALYGYKFYLSEGNLELTIEYLSKFLHICELSNLKLFIIQVLKNFISQYCRRRVQQLVTQYSHKLYQYIKHIDNIEFYLFPPNFSTAFTTFMTFSRHHPHQFRQLIQKIIQFIFRRPVASYLLQFFNILNDFIKFDPMRGRSIHYASFEDTLKPLKPSNPYLIIFYAYSLYNAPQVEKTTLLRAITLNIDRVSDFTKKKVLAKYYLVILQQRHQQNQFKKICLFRQAKQYLSSSINRKMARQIYKFSKLNESFQLVSKMLIKKSKLIIKCYKNRILDL